jgi:hypothetical protein
MKNYEQYLQDLMVENEIFTIKSDKLIINHIIKDYFLYEKPENIKNDYMVRFCENRSGDINDFLAKTKNSSFRTCFHFTYNGMYSMSINIKKVTFNGSNDFTYYISGNSGDFSMHQNGMIRATRTINLEVIKHFFPDVKRNKKYRDFEKGLIKFSDLGLYSVKYIKYVKAKKIKNFNI